MLNKKDLIQVALMLGSFLVALAGFVSIAMYNTKSTGGW